MVDVDVDKTGNKEGKCPFCESELEYGLSEPDGESFTYEVTCPKCHAWGQEFYRLTYCETTVRRK